MKSTAPAVLFSYTEHIRPRSPEALTQGAP